MLPPILTENFKFSTEILKEEFLLYAITKTLSLNKILYFNSGMNLKLMNKIGCSYCYAVDVTQLLYHACVQNTIFRHESIIYLKMDSVLKTYIPV